MSTKKKILVIVLFIFLGVAQNSFAVLWDDGAADPNDHSWCTPENWQGDALPIGTTDVNINNDGSGPIIERPCSAEAREIRIEPSTTKVNPAELTINSGSLTMGGGNLLIAAGAGSVGTLNINGGTVNAFAEVWVGNNGHATLNMNGGELNIPTNLWIPRGTGVGDGHLQLDGGVITCSNFVMRTAGDIGTMDIAGGTLVIQSNLLYTINDYIANGWITGFGGRSSLNVFWDGYNTIVTAIDPDSPLASNPNPSDGKAMLDDPNLSWKAGASAESHDVYLGIDYREVENALPNLLVGDIDKNGQTDINDLTIICQQWLSDPSGFEFSADIKKDHSIINMEDFSLLSQDWQKTSVYKGNQTETSYRSADNLKFFTPYYWRIDEIQGPNVWRGDVWSFHCNPQNPVELWRDCDMAADPLEVEVAREWNENGGVYKVVRYTIATWLGQKSIMVAYYGYPLGGTNLPALVHIHGGGQKASLDNVKDYVSRGYACISVNWGGLDMGESINTDWGAVNPTQTNVPGYTTIMPSDITIDDMESPRNNNWYMLTYACRRALTFLEQQPEVDPDRLGVFGHSMGGNLTMYVAGSDSRVKAAVPSVGGAGYVTYDFPGIPGTALSINGDVELFRNTLEHQAYSPYVNCPILFLSATNDYHGHMDSAYLTYSFIPHNNIGFSLTPHMNHMFISETAVARPLWFDQHLKQSFTTPTIAVTNLSLDEPDGIPLFEVTPDSSMPIVAVDLYYGVDLDPRARFWRNAQGAQVGNKWVAQLPVLDTNLPLYAFANVIYQIDHSEQVWGYPATNEVIVSSKMHTATSSMLKAAGVIETDLTLLLIDDFSRGWDDWYVLNENNSNLTQWWTRKITDPKWRGPSGAKLKLVVKTLSTNQFTINVVENEWRAYRGPRKTFEATFSLTGSSEWQVVILEASDFLNINDNTLLSAWDELDKIGIKPGASSWTTPRPEFKEISWTY